MSAACSPRRSPQGRRITPAAEWLLDNFYLIEEQIRTAKRHLPTGYSRELPRLAAGPSARLPRVFDLAFHAIAHGDGRFDVASLSRFVVAYQTAAPLKLGELWALPIMLRLALIENLRRIAARIAAGTADRNRAETWAVQMLDVAERDPTSLILVIADMARSQPPMVSSFVAELARRLQGQSAALALPLTWIEQRLSESATSIEQLVQAEAQEQAGEQVSISNTIGSLRLLGATDWRLFVEAMSEVEHKLREDPHGRYGRMDFATRDRYRHAVESIAKRSDLSESEVARKAIQLAHAGDRDAPDGDAPREAHVGFYLIDKGRRQLEQEAQAALLGAGDAAPDRRPGAAARLPRRRRGRHRRDERPPAGAGGARWHTRAVALAPGSSAGVGREPARGGTGELARHPARHTERAAAHGFHRRTAGVLAHAGRRAHDARPAWPASTISSKRSRSAISRTATPACISAS